jgi:hypothetical protein
MNGTGAGKTCGREPMANFNMYRSLHGAVKSY